jgi:hypothetical protein
MIWTSLQIAMMSCMFKYWLMRYFKYNLHEMSYSLFIVRILEIPRSAPVTRMTFSCFCVIRIALPIWQAQNETYNLPVCHFIVLMAVTRSKTSLVSWVMNFCEHPLTTVLHDKRGFALSNHFLLLMQDNAYSCTGFVLNPSHNLF